MKSILTWLCLTAVGLGQITIPDRIEPYQPIVGGCNCIIPANGSAQFIWRTDDKSKSIASEPDGKKLFIWAPPGSHFCEVTVLTTIFKKVLTLVVDPADPNNKDKWKVVEQEVVDKFDWQRYEKSFIVGESPGPGPGPTPTPPGPGPGPGPTPPPPTDEFAAKAFAWIGAIPAASYSKEKAMKVASNYSAVAAQAVATSGWNLDAFVNQTKAKNRETLTPEETTAWSTPFFVPLAQYQAQLFSDRKLTVSDVQGIAKLWNDTAEAIRKAAEAKGGGTSAERKLIDPLSPEKPVAASAKNFNSNPYSNITRLELSRIVQTQLSAMIGR